MYESIVILAASMLVAIIFDTIAWKKCCSDPYVQIKGPPVSRDASLSEEEVLQRRRKNGRVSEITRTFILGLISLVTILFFGRVDIIPEVQQNYLVQLLIIVSVLYGVIYYIFVGPSRLARSVDQSDQLISKTGFQEFYVPYLVRLPGYFAVILGIIGVMVIHIINGIQSDFTNLNTATQEIVSLQQNPLVTIRGYEIISLRLVGFGDWISHASQKYIVVSLLMLFFIIFLQSSFLRYLIFETSIDKYKLVFWVIVIANVGFSVVYLPLQYSSLHNIVHDALQQKVASLEYVPTANPNEVSGLLFLESLLLDRDTNWLMLQLFTGYGNIAAAVIIIGSILIKNIFLSDMSTISVLSLLLPSGFFIRMRNYFAQIGVDQIDQDKP